jgi:hypothetical protein
MLSKFHFLEGCSCGERGNDVGHDEGLCRGGIVSGKYLNVISGVSFVMSDIYSPFPCGCCTI